jgi:hypothetical protein
LSIQFRSRCLIVAVRTVSGKYDPKGKMYRGYITGKRVAELGKQGLHRPKPKQVDQTCIDEAFVAAKTQDKLIDQSEPRLRWNSPPHKADQAMTGSSCNVAVPQKFGDANQESGAFGISQHQLEARNCGIVKGLG